MGDRWHHGDPEAEREGESLVEACEVLEAKLVAASGLEPGDWALDFGSGIGSPRPCTWPASAPRGSSESRTTRQSTRRRESAPPPPGSRNRVSFVTLGDTDYQRLPFGPSTFRAVFFYESVCHLSDRPAFFREVRRVLAPGGRLAAIDWLQRPYGKHQTDAQLEAVMAPVNQRVRIPGHGTVESYRQAMEAAGLRVLEARDLFPGEPCWGSTPSEQRPEWLAYKGPDPGVHTGEDRSRQRAPRASSPSGSSSPNADARWSIASLNSGKRTR